jgi:hypothetical protein
MLRGLYMDGHDPLTLSSMSLLHLFVNVVYVRTIFTAEHVLSRMDTPSLGLSRITIYYQF